MAKAAAVTVAPTDLEYMQAGSRVKGSWGQFFFCYGKMLPTIVANVISTGGRANC